MKAGIVPTTKARHITTTIRETGESWLDPLRHDTARPLLALQYVGEIADLFSNTPLQEFFYLQPCRLTFSANRMAEAKHSIAANSIAYSEAS